MPTRVLLVRHGQSEWNAVGRWQGQADPPLSDVGRRQAKAAARTLGAVDAVVASDLQRAAETATIIAGDLGVGPVLIEPLLRERDAGEWSGLTRAEIERQYPGYLADGLRPPGWETDEDVLARALAALARIHDQVPDGEVLAVTHGGLVYVVEAHLSGSFERLANGGGRYLSVDGDGLVLGERVLLVGDEHTPVTVPGQI
ncbi:MAG: histidine phosphatase family protein [Acidimicrobiales bacterium]